MHIAKVKSEEHVGGLNLRSSPSSKGDIIDKLAPGDEIMVDEHGSKGGWLYVTYKGQRGWVWSAHVERLPAQPPDVALPRPPVIKEREPNRVMWALAIAAAVVFTVLGTVMTCSM